MSGRVAVRQPLLQTFLIAPETVVAQSRRTRWRECFPGAGENAGVVECAVGPACIDRRPRPIPGSDAGDGTTGSRALRARGDRWDRARPCARGPRDRRRELRGQPRSPPGDGSGDRAVALGGNPDHGTLRPHDDQLPRGRHPVRFCGGRAEDRFDAEDVRPARVRRPIHWANQTRVARSDSRHGRLARILRRQRGLRRPDGRRDFESGGGAAVRELGRAVSPCVQDSRLLGERPGGYADFRDRVQRGL